MPFAVKNGKEKARNSCNRQKICPNSMYLGTALRSLCDLMLLQSAACSFHISLKRHDCTNNVGSVGC